MALETECDYELGHVIQKNVLGTISRALHFDTAKLIVVRTLEYSGISEVQLDARYKFVKKWVNKVREIESENLIDFLLVDKNKEAWAVNIAMEFVPGGSLTNIVKYFGSFKEKLVQIYVAQTLQGLKALHENNLIHGDLKLNNLFVDDVGTVKLGDFGFMKQTFLLEDPEDSPESFQYLLSPLLNSETNTPPEIFQWSEYTLDDSFDVWCLGLVIYEMLSGKSLFGIFQNHQDKLFTYLKGLKEVPPIKLKISKYWRDFLKRWLQPDPNERATVDELLEHPFITFSEKDLRSSKEASNLISFFSIAASQLSDVSPPNESNTDSQNIQSLNKDKYLAESTSVREPSCK